MDAAPLSPAEQDKRNALPWCYASGALNNIFGLWTFAGSVFVLFLSELQLPKGQIGALLSLFQFCGLLALGFAPVAARWGRKRVFLACYGVRKLVMAALLLLPWIVARSGHGTALVFLTGIIIVFAILRALAETAYYPWQQEFVPNAVRGRFTAWSTVFGLVASGGALAIAGYVIGSGTGLDRYLLLIGAGSTIGFLGVVLMAKIPGGAPRQDPVKFGRHLAKMIEALRDRNFRSYLGGLAGLTIGTSMLISFLPLYLREQLGLASGTVVRLDIVVMVGSAFSSLAWGWLADRLGSRPVLMPSAACMLLLPLAWLLLPRHLAHAAVWCAGVYFAYGLISSGVAIGAGRLLFNGVVPAEASTAYTAIYYAWLGVTGGIAPLLAGGILSARVSRDAGACIGPFPADGYALLFATALLCLVAGWWLYGRVRPDGVHTTRSVARNFVNWVAQR